jgi:hypothetical protein
MSLTAWAILIIVWSISADPVVAADDIILRTTVTPQEAWVGQQLILHVDVLAKDGWAQLRKVSDAEVDGAYLLRLESQGTRLSETVEGDSYSGQRYEFMLFAQRGGKLTVPAVPVDVEIKTWGAGGSTRIERMSLAAIDFVALTPPGAEDLRGLISSGNFTANQTWEPETENPVVGDAIKRTIRLRAEDVSGMAFAPMRYSEIEGLGIYPGEPVVDDNFARGDLSGSRREAVTYVLEREGNIEIPAVDFTWWDVDSEELKHIVLPGLSLVVSGGLATEPEAGEQPYTRLSWSTLLAIAIAAVALIGFGGRLLNRWSKWRNTRRESENMYFRRIRQSARSGNQKALLRDTMRWLDRINKDSRPARLDRFLMQYGSSQPRLSALDLDRPGIAAFLKELTTARKRWQIAQQGTEQLTRLLPELNGGK